MDYRTYQQGWREANKERIREYNRRWKERNPTYYKDRRKRRLEAEVDQLMNFTLPIITDSDILSGAKQVQDGVYDGLCHACWGPIFGGAVPCLDYETRTKKIRGVICSRCKSVLRTVKRSPEMLDHIKTYLEKELSDELYFASVREIDEPEPLFSPPPPPQP